jgi:predicted metalloprotease
MRWRRTGRDQIEDRRGQGWSAGRALPIGGGGLGLVVLLITLLLRGGGGGDLGQALDGLGGLPAEQSGRLPGAPDPDSELVDFMNFVVEDVQASWEQVFSDAGRSYEPTVLVLFDDATETACGTGSAASGPFYCPADGKMYLDLGFFRELRGRFGAPGDFAQAYVIAHEAGHHVQTLLGIDEDVRAAQNDDPSKANELSIAMELQADCFAGVWGHSAFNEDLLESGDLEEGLGAAAAVGDDRIQRETSGRVNRETWTHGSSEQRMRWFRRGFDSGSPEDCDTFAGV